VWFTFVLLDGTGLIANDRDGAGWSIWWDMLDSLVWGSR
jgi:hypothetical protein